MWDEDPAYVEGYYALIKRLLLLTFVVALLSSLLVSSWEPVLKLGRIFVWVGAVLAGYAAVVWVAVHTVRLLIRWARNSRSDGATQE